MLIDTPKDRHFLGWDAPATVKIREFLLPQELSGPVDLSTDLIVVPTDQAGRRLREALARHCSMQKTALLSVHVVKRADFLRLEGDSDSVAEPMQAAAFWADVLMKTDLSKYNGLFPSRIPSQDFLWALHTGEMIQGLRFTLADGGYNIADVYNDFQYILEEVQRWHDLAELEKIYLEHINNVGLKDSFVEMIKQVNNPKPPKGISRIVLAAVPDPTPLVVKKLELLASHIPIVVLVHAPESLADCFDEWGRPIKANWQKRHIDIPDPEANILLCGSPRSQSRKVLDIIARESGRFGPADVALGVPDGEVIPFLETDLSGAGLVSFNPAGKQADQHPLSQLLRSFRNLLIDGDYAAVSAFLRNSDVLDYLSKYNHPHPNPLPSRERGNNERLDLLLSKEKGNNERTDLLPSMEKGSNDKLDPLLSTERWSNVKPDRLLEEMDNYQNEHLPQSLSDMVRAFTKSATAEERQKKFPNLTGATGFLGQLVQDFNNTDTVSSMRSFLQTIFEFRTVDTRQPEDKEFAEVARIIEKALHLITDSPLPALNLDKESILEMLLWHLSRQKYYPEPEEALIDLEGWLELAWNDAPFLIVTGMNDGSVPRSRPDHIFLPDTLRRQLNLPHDDGILAADVYLMTAMIESRLQQGRVCFISGKTSGSGDVLKPSRLLFQCEDSELHGRAERLFGTPPEVPESYTSSLSFQLEALPPPDVPEYRLEPKRIPVTAFREYLDCPFRFYLKRVLDMEAMDDLKTELDAMDFGSLVHDVLYEMACDEEMRQCADIARLQDFLCDRAADWIKHRLGSSPPVQVEAQMESARQRLRRAAGVQAGMVKQGWEILHGEMKIEGSIEGMLVRGKIDRIDRHRQTGRIRVLDYKTSEKAVSPEESHFGSLSKEREYPEYARLDMSGRERRWADLQLPLYALLLSSDTKLKGPYELGYFNLPKALNDTGVVLWEGFSAYLLESAGRCARGVIKDIRERRFWPPSRKLRFDDFEDLFSADPCLCVNAESFALFMNRGRLL